MWSRCERVVDFAGTGFAHTFAFVAMGLPVVAPKMPALEELITPQTGTLVDPPNDADAYASAICLLASDQDRRRTIGRRGTTGARPRCG